MPTPRIAFALAIAVLLASCSDDSPTDSNGNNNNNSSTFKNEAAATINGVQWSATNVTATRNEAGGIIPLTFTAFGANESRITFGIAFGAARSFTIDGNAVQSEFRYGGKSYGKNQSGTITITALTNKGMRGSFSVNAAANDGESGSAVGTFDVEF